MDEYVTLESFSDFTKLVVNHMESTSYDKKVTNALKNKFVKLENEVKILKEEISKLTQENSESNNVCSCGVTIERFESLEDKVINLSSVDNREEDKEILKLEKEIELVSTKLVEVEFKLSSLGEEQNIIKNVQKRKSDRKIKCNHCDKIFPSHSMIEKHMADEHVQKEIKCDHCDLLFHTTWRLKMHMKNHTGRMKRNCHFFNSNKDCPYENLGCKFNHIYSDECKFGTKCERHMCQYRH